MDSLTPVPLGRLATLADLEALPPPIKGEIIDGVLYTAPRPRARHQRIGYQILTGLADTYDEGASGAGGWVILPEPGIEVEGSPEFAPDVAAWRVERLPELPEDAPIRVVPDWICEVHSPSTRSYDRTKKRDFYARIGVQYLWFIDPANREMMALRRTAEGQWLELTVSVDDERVRAEPFPLVEFNLAQLWSLAMRRR